MHLHLCTPILRIKFVIRFGAHKLRLGFMLPLAHIYYRDQDECINTFRPRQNGQHFKDDILDAFSWMKSLVFKMSLKYVPKGPIYKNQAVVQIMAWRRIGDKPLSELMLTRFTDAYMRH